MQLNVPNAPIVFAAEEPTIPTSGWLTTDWKWFNTTNMRWYDYDGGWVMQGEAGANTSGEGIVEVKNMKVRNGLIVELEEE